MLLLKSFFGFRADRFYRLLFPIIISAALLLCFFSCFIFLVIDRSMDDLSPNGNLLFNALGSIYIPALCLVLYIWELCREISRRRFFVNSFIIISVFAVFIILNIPTYKAAWHGIVLGERTYIEGEVTHVEWRYGKRIFPLDGTVTINGKTYITDARFLNGKLLKAGDRARFTIAPESAHIIGIGN